MTDTQRKQDLLGVEYQWASVSGSYQWDFFWLPSARLGLHKNLAGSKLAYVAGGITVGKYINLDVAYSPETIEKDNEQVSRGTDISVSVDYWF